MVCRTHFLSYNPKSPYCKECLQHDQPEPKVSLIDNERCVDIEHAHSGTVLSGTTQQANTAAKESIAR